MWHCVVGKQKRWEVIWNLAGGQKKRLNHGSFYSSSSSRAQWYIKRERARQKEGRKDTKARDRTWTGARGFFCVLGGLFVKAALWVTGLAPSASAVTGNYKQAKCVTCPSAVAESPRGRRAHAGWLAACRNLCLGNCLLFTVLPSGTTERCTD